MILNKRPFDNGMYELHNTKKLSDIDEFMLGRARVFDSMHANRHIIVLLVKEESNIRLDETILDDCLNSLLDVITEFNCE